MTREGRCVGCGFAFEYEYPGTGRPRAWCDACVAGVPTAVTATTLTCECGAMYEPGRASVPAQRCVACRRARDRARVREAMRRRRRGANAQRALPELCGCGRDYLTLPLDHRCARPLRSS